MATDLEFTNKYLHIRSYKMMLLFYLVAYACHLEFQ